MKLFGGVQVAEYSSSLTPQQRKGILRDFKLGKLQLLICSDAMARGMDIQNVSYVISYDVPNYVRSYIHRVGRTARAGNKGRYSSMYTDVPLCWLFFFFSILRRGGGSVQAKLL